METKWISIGLLGVFVALFAAVAVEKYSANQCKIAYASSTKSADEIFKLCGK